ncbi:hypothetical protein NLI96_g4807 [Meripilus lineatus]|uniref:Uncharacterized protein n=1 Tax=Meripilus lineatus TaxID=2056292 RepID=A0AAD5YHK9_9APHY|nr:hypothetical protein NLI96_g4807 [Physisporinus lineatus]
MSDKPLLLLRPKHCQFPTKQQSQVKCQSGTIKWGDYFKGEWLTPMSIVHWTHWTPRNAQGRSTVEPLTSSAYAKLKNVPKVQSEDAEELLAPITTFHLRVDRGPTVRLAILFITPPTLCVV